MTEINPLLLTGGVIGAITAILVAAYALVKDKKATMGFERTMNDGEIMRRLMAYAKPYRKQFTHMAGTGISTCSPSPTTSSRR